MKVISIDHLVKTYKVKIKNNFWKDLILPKYRQIKAVDDISFEVEQGETVAFLGQNGAGKTTTIKMLTGLIYPTSGKVEVLGYSPQNREAEYLRRIGLVMGNKAGLNWDLTAKQSFELFQQIYRIPRETYEKRLKSLTLMLEIEKLLEVQIRKLSLGERMKMELVGSIIHNPEVLFLDEPTIGLDILAKKKIREFLREIQKISKISIILTSHDMDDVEKVCDRVIVINKGKKVYDDQLSILMKKYNQYKYVKLITDDKFKEDDGLPGILVEADDRGRIYRVEPKLMPKLISMAMEKYNLADVDIETVPLEAIISDLFLEK